MIMFLGGFSMCVRRVSVESLGQVNLNLGFGSEKNLGKQESRVSGK